MTHARSFRERPYYTVGGWRSVGVYLSTPRAAALHKDTNNEQANVYAGIDIAVP